MKKINILKSIFCTLSIVVLITSCAPRTTDVESTILEGSKSVASVFDYKPDIELNIEKETDLFRSYPTGEEDKVFQMRIPENFYEDEQFKIPVMTDEVDLPKGLNQKLEKAKEIVVSYIENSEYIKDEDKADCQNAVENVTIHYGRFEDDVFKECPMLTSDSTIYVSRAFENYLSEYMFIHELIHVASNVTNKGSEYEFSVYRSSKLNEVITDLISVELSTRNEISGYEISAYQDYYEYAFYAIAKFDIIKAYYYSDEYSNIVSNEFDLYTILMDQLYSGEGEEEFRTVIYYIVNEWGKM